MKKRNLAGSTRSDPVQVDCPACPGKFPLVDLVPVEQVQCPKCGSDWRVRLQDLPGRVLVDLLPLAGKPT